MIRECNVYEENFAALLDGMLTLDEKSAIQCHIDECLYCKQELLNMKRHWNRVEQLNSGLLKITIKKAHKFSKLLQLIKKFIWPPS